MKQTIILILCLSFFSSIFGQEILNSKNVQRELLTNVRDLKEYSIEDKNLFTLVDSLQQVSVKLVNHLRQGKPSQEYLKNINHNVKLLGKLESYEDSVKMKKISAIRKDFLLKINCIDSKFAIDPRSNAFEEIEFTVILKKRINGIVTDITEEGNFQVIAMGSTQDTSEIKIPPQIPFSYSSAKHCIKGSLVTGDWIFYAIDPFTRKICSGLFPESFLRSKKNIVIYLD